MRQRYDVSRCCCVEVPPGIVYPAIGLSAAYPLNNWDGLYDGAGFMTVGNTDPGTQDVDQFQKTWDGAAYVTFQSGIPTLPATSAIWLFGFNTNLDILGDPEVAPPAVTVELLFESSAEATVQVFPTAPFKSWVMHQPQSITIPAGSLSFQVDVTTAYNLWVALPHSPSDRFACRLTTDAASPLIPPQHFLGQPTGETLSNPWNANDFNNVTPTNPAHINLIVVE